MKLSLEQQEIVDNYYKNEAKKLHDMVDNVLFRLHFTNIDKDEFYSLATEIFVDVLKSYDNSKSFNGFLYSCLYKKFCTNMTRETREKRCAKFKIEKHKEDGEKVIETIIIPDVRIDAPISDDSNENLTYGDILADPNNVENQIFDEENKDEWHIEVKEFLKRLSPLQRKIILKIADNYTPDEICSDLHITKQHYANSIQRIYADEKIGILRPLVERKEG